MGARMVRLVQSIGHDLRSGGRVLRRSPAFAFTTVITLTLGIGLNAAFFTLVNGVLLKPWLVSDPDRVVTVYTASSTLLGSAGNSASEFRYLRDNSTRIDLVAMLEWGAAFEDRALPRAVIRAVSGNYFSVLGVPLTLGRGLQVEEDEIGSPLALAVIGHRLWQRRYGSSPDVIGQSLVLDRVSFRIVGVSAPGVTDSQFQQVDAWLPLAAAPLLDSGSSFLQGFLVDPGLCCVRLAGRLRAGVTRRQAQLELSALDQQFRQATGQTIANPQKRGLIVAGTSVLDQPGAEPVARIVSFVFAGLALLLIVSAANLGNVQLARAFMRRRELAVRRALGAGRGRLVRQLVTESLVPGGIAVAFSLIGAVAFPPLAARAVGALGADVSVDGRSILFAAALMVAIVAVSTVGPATRGVRLQGLRQEMTSAGKIRLRSGLLCVQVAASVIVLAGASLLWRSVIHASTVDLGFAVDLTEITVPSGAAEEAVRAALRNAGISSPAQGLMPLASSRLTRGVRRQEQGPSEFIRSYALGVSSGYFEGLRIRVRSGRVFTARDDPADIVINEMLARQLFGTESAVGRTVLVSNEPRRIVGVVADAHLSSLYEIEPTVFLRLSPAGSRVSFLLPGNHDLVERVRAVAIRASPQAAVAVRPFRDVLHARLQGPMTAASIAGAIGLLTVALAGVGVFGVFMFDVQTRTREIGIRRALGANRRHILGTTVRQQGWPLVIGLILGVLASALAAPLLGAYLIGIRPHDISAYVGVLGVIALTALVATWVPSRHALRVEPVVALRDE